jgi:hypothetical protein
VGNTLANYCSSSPNFINNAFSSAFLKATLISFTFNQCVPPSIKASAKCPNIILCCMVCQKILDLGGSG